MNRKEIAPEKGELASKKVSKDTHETRPYSFSGFLSKLLRDAQALIGLLLLLGIISCALAAPFLAPFDPETQFDDGITDSGAPIAPDSKFIWGTDPLGRDILSRVLYGGQVSLTVALVVNTIVLVAGTVCGITAGYFGGLIDLILGRILEIMLAFPTILLAIALSTIVRPSVMLAIGLLSLTGWTSIARLVRAQVLALKQRQYIEASRALGVKNTRILLHHILPHLISPLIVLIVLAIPTTILAEAALSYLGAGIPSNIPSWGNMIQDGARYYRTAPWIVIFPGLAIFFTVLGFNLFGDGLRDVLDPHYQRRN